MDLSFVLPVLHGYFEGPFLLAWSFEPLVTTVIVALIAGYAWAWRRVQSSTERPFPAWYAVSYFSGVALLTFSLLGPLETYNEQLFTLHMSQHLAVMQIVVPLMLLGRPVQLVLRALPPRTTKRTIGFLFGRQGPRMAVLGLTAPVVGFLLFNANMGFWHVPAYYDAAVRVEWIHNLQHAMFFGTAALYWWPIIDPVPRHHRLTELWAMGSVFLSMMIGSAIGAIITLAESVLYPFYLDAGNPWNWSPLLDQQVGGLIMWIGSGFLYFAVLFVLVVQLLQRDDASVASQASPARQEPTAAS